MQGRVYSLVRPGQHQDKSHPNVVILQTAADSYLSVVGFSPGKDAVEAFRRAEFIVGVEKEQFSIVIDHRLELTPANPDITLHDCEYVAQTADKLTEAQLKAGVYWGQLSPRAVKAVVETVLRREAIMPFLPKRTVKLLTKWLAEHP